MGNTTGWAEMQQNPLVNLANATAQAELYSHNLYPDANYAAYYAHPQNPNPDPLQSYSANVIHPPGVEPYLTASVNSYPDTLSNVSFGLETQQLGSAYAYLQTVASASAGVRAYYQGPNVIRQFSLNHFGTDVTVPASVTEKLVTEKSTSSLVINQTVGSRKCSTWKKGPKKTKVVQSAWCEICKVDCNSKSVLDQHKLGKKHKKNLEKLIGANASIVAPAPVPAPAPTPALAPAPASAMAPTPALASVPPAASTVSNNLVIGQKENLDKGKSASGQKARKKAAEAEDLETKRRKILEGGAAVEAVRMCAVCNVVCNSETVFKYHLAGQKHAAMMKKHVAATGMAAAT